MKQTLDLYPDRGFASSILYILYTMDDKYSILRNISKYMSNYDCLLCVLDDISSKLILQQ